MASANIDFDRGVLIRQNPSAGGIQIYMYVDAPGVFLNAFGQEVDADLAAGAGYDVALLARRRLIQERKALALAAIEEELEGADAGEAVVVRQRGDWSLVDIGLGRFVVKDPDGAVVTPHALPREQADIVFEKLTPGLKDRKVKQAKDDPEEVPAA